MVASVISGLILFLVIFSGLIPQVRQVLKMRRELKLEKETLQSLRLKASDLEDLQTIAAYRAKNQVDRILPSRKPLLELLAGLSTMAGKNEVRFTEFSLSPGEISSASADFLAEADGGRSKHRASQKKNQDYETMPIELGVEGQFSDVQQFLTDVEQMSPLVTITSLSLQIRGQGVIQAEDKVQATLAIQSYYFTRPVSAALEKALPKLGQKERGVITEIETYEYPSVAVQQRIISGGYEDIFGLSATEVGLEELEEVKEQVATQSAQSATQSAQPK